MYVYYKEDQTSFEFGTLTNLTHKLSTGKQITYDVSHSDYPRWNYIGSNKTKKFKLNDIIRFIKRVKVTNILFIEGEEND